MNKTLSIGLAGFSFTIEEHAYIKLSDYLSALKGSMDPEEASEVMHDIELRIVEIFKERLGKQREVINNDDVEAIISLIGTPEQIDEQEQEYTAKERSNPQYSTNTTGSKQLFRDPTNKIIGGVCSGLANYIGVDPVWVRLALVLLVFLQGFGLLTYIILWIVVPKAKTAGDFLKMKGKPLNFDNLKEQSNKVVQFATDSSEKVSQYYESNKGSINQSGKTLIRVLCACIGIFITAPLAIIFFLGSIAILFGGFSFGNGAVNIPENISFYLDNGGIFSSGIIFFGFISLFIPAIIFTLLTIKLFSPHLKIKYMGYLIGVLIACWIALMCFIGYSVSTTKMNYSGENEEVENIAINTTSDTLSIETKKVSISPNFKNYIGDVYSDKKTIFEKDWPSISIKKRADVKSPYLVIKKSAEGYNLPLEIKVPVEIQGNKILLPNYYEYPYKYRMRGYDVDYELYTPLHYTIIKNGEIYLEDEDDKDDYNTPSQLQDPNNVGDSIIINNQKVSVKDIEIKKGSGTKIIKDSLKEVSVSIKNGEPQIRIKTK
ncbi:PspC domain-containing protein [Elizabethkingia sp. JS20170427COW]|uniref:PspC domain-containing protein n=1 Tax=Elizabethkingia sp. JS20170427COW TaxID=2583851 RepID=UPI001110610A|nr:PspC domain-containing protein [Elizabethkingia sp. JS20170427COW]QCX53941.1 PspC domain-containing protein [Elizabethkingia sp. JS20170427COW]